jgi:hypothetical protein
MRTRAFMGRSLTRLKCAGFRDDALKREKDSDHR